MSGLLWCGAESLRGRLRISARSKRAPIERQLYPFHAWKNARHFVVVDDFQAELDVGKHYVSRACCDQVEDLSLLSSRFDGAFCALGAVREVVEIEAGDVVSG